jgi:hypothetical protein
LVPLVFQVVEEALGDRVVPAVALAAHRTLHAVFVQFVLERLAGVLAASIANTMPPSLIPRPMASVSTG